MGQMRLALLKTLHVGGRFRQLTLPGKGCEKEQVRRRSQKVNSLSESPYVPVVRGGEGRGGERERKIEKTYKWMNENGAFAPVSIKPKAPAVSHL